MQSLWIEHRQNTQQNFYFWKKKSYFETGEEKCWAYWSGNMSVINNLGSSDFVWIFWGTNQCTTIFFVKFLFKCEVDVSSIIVIKFYTNVFSFSFSIYGIFWWHCDPLWIPSAAFKVVSFNDQDYILYFGGAVNTIIFVIRKITSFCKQLETILGSFEWGYDVTWLVWYFINRFLQYLKAPRIHLKVQGKTSHDSVLWCKVFTSTICCWSTVLAEIELGLTGSGDDWL